MYGKIINNNLEYAPLNYTMDDGCIIANFNNSVETMVKYGYKEVIDNIPEYDESKEKPIFYDYEETENTITVNYIILPFKSYNLEDRIKELEAEILELKKQQQTMYELMRTVYEKQ